MLIRLSKFLSKDAWKLISIRNEGSDGSIRSAGGKFAEMQEARERQYFHKKNQEYLDYIREELKKGRTIEDVIDDTKDRLQAKEKCKAAKAKGHLPEDASCDD